MKMFVPLLVGLYESYFDFGVLGTVWLYFKAKWESFDRRLFEKPANLAGNLKKS